MHAFVGAINIETPPYVVINKYEAFETRQYQEQIHAQVSYTAYGDNIFSGAGGGFRYLAGYIFGGNASRKGGNSESVAMTGPVLMKQQETIAMTGPVMMQKNSNGNGGTGSGGTAPPMVQMSFVMPSKYKSVSDLPIPDNRKVELITVPPVKLAAIKFSWGMSPAYVASKEKELRENAKLHGVKLSEDPSQIQYAQYNPPWTLPFCRTNEILIPVVGDGAETETVTDTCSKE